VAGGERVVLEMAKIFPDAPIYTSVFDPEKAKPFAKMDVRTSFLQKIPFFNDKQRTGRIVFHIGKFREYTRTYCMRNHFL